MPPPPTPNILRDSDEEAPTTPHTQDEQVNWLPTSNIQPRSNSANPRLLTYIDHIQRFSNASQGEQPHEGTSTEVEFPNEGTPLNNINMISDYLYRNLPPSTSTEDVNFRSRILHHFSDIHRLQNQVHELMNSNYRRNNPDTSDLPVNNIPIQLRNLSRELIDPNRITGESSSGNTSGNREAYYVESTDEDDQSFQYNDEADAELFYYSEDNDAMDTSEDSINEEEEESIPSEEEVAYLRSDIESNERLLLSSARQNPLNVNTLILPPYPLSTPGQHRYSSRNIPRSSSRPVPWLATSSSGIPLSRQNAIRGARHHYRRYNPLQIPISTTTGEGETIRDKYLKELSTLEEDSNNRLKKLLTIEAEELHKDIESVYNAIKKIPTFQGESPLFYKNNYEYSKKFRILFFAKLNRAKFHTDQKGLPNLENSMDLYLKQRRNRSLFLNIKPTIPPPPKANMSKPIKKKRRIHRNQRSAKRQKVAGKIEEVETHLLFNSKLSLSKSEKENILSSLPSTFMQSGSSFTLSISQDKLKQCDLVFINVTRPEISGVFNFTVDSQIQGMTPLHCMLLKLHSFVKYFCGFTENSLPRNKLLVRKLNVLDRISVDQKIKYISHLKHSQMNIPFVGHLIDFDKYDLRFMDKGSYGNRESSNRIRLQLSEWMKLSPFIQFKENYFISFLHELEDNLKNFSSITAKKEQKSEALHLTKQFKANLYQLTKDFGFINDKNSQIPFLDEQQSRKQGKYRDGFLEDWERSLAHRLCEVITANDSSTLLNVQLNYVLFEIKVDLSKLLDEYILFIFEHCDVSSKDKVEYINKYKDVYNSILRDENLRITKKGDHNPIATLLGSIDRKLGQIELHNTVSNLYYREAKYMTNIIMTRHSPVTLTDYGSRNTYVYDDFEVFNNNDSTLPVPVNSRTFNSKSGYVENDEIVETKLVGSGRFVNRGNPICGVI